MTGIELIAAERARQVEKEGWTAEHDDEHDNEDLALAACYYALPAPMPITYGRGEYIIGPDSLFPGEWSEEWMKRGDDKIRNLVKAGALIAAEIDRLQRRAVAAAGEGK